METLTADKSFNNFLSKKRQGNVKVTFKKSSEILNFKRENTQYI